MRPILIAASLGLNVVLLTVVVLLLRVPESSPESRDETPEARGATSGTRPEAASAEPSTASGNAGGSTIAFNWKGASLDDIMAELRRAGAPAQVLVLVASSLVNERYQARMHAIGRPENAPRWRYGRSVPSTPEVRVEREKLREEIQAEVRRLLGTDPLALLAESSTQAGLSTRFGNLPTETIARIRQVESDYDRIRANQGRGVDAERLLEQELAKDLAAVMAPEEYADYMAFNSRFAVRLQQRLGDAEISDDAYLKIYAAADRFRQDFDARPDSAALPEISASYRLPELAYLREAASEEVLAGIALKQDREFQRIMSQTAQAEAPPATVLRQYETYLAYRSEQERRSGQPDSRDAAEIKAFARQTYDAFAGSLDEARRQAFDRTPFGRHLKNVLEK